MQVCIKLWGGPRDVPARSAQEQGGALGIPECSGAVGAAANRDGSRSAELDAALSEMFIHKIILDRPTRFIRIEHVDPVNGG